MCHLLLEFRNLSSPPLTASGGLERLQNSVQCRKQSFCVTIIIIRNVLIAVMLVCLLLDLSTIIPTLFVFTSDDCLELSIIVMQ